MPGAEDRERQASLKSVVDGLADVSDRTQNIVRDEIALAKAEVAQKVSRLGKGAAVGAVSGVFVALAGLMFLHGLGFFFWWLLGSPGNQIFWGFFITAALLLLLAVLGGLLAIRFFKKGSPPVPTMAIEEAQLVRQAFQSSDPVEALGAPSGTDPKKQPEEAKRP